MKTGTHFYHISLSSSYELHSRRMRNVSGKAVEKAKTHNLSSVTIFKKSCHL
jgi:hypothetical protein